MMALISTKWAVVAASCISLAWYRNAFTVVLFTGGFASGLLSKILKSIFNETRPTDIAADPGMPSSHAMNLFFLATSLSMYVTPFGF